MLLKKLSLVTLACLFASGCVINSDADSIIEWDIYNECNGDSIGDSVSFAVSVAFSNSATF